MNQILDSKDFVHLICDYKLKEFSTKHEILPILKFSQMMIKVLRYMLEINTEKSIPLTLKQQTLAQISLEKEKIKEYLSTICI